MRERPQEHFKNTIFEWVFQVFVVLVLTCFLKLPINQPINQLNPQFQHQFLQPQSTERLEGKAYT